MRRLLFISALLMFATMRCQAQFLEDMEEVFGHHRDHRWLLGHGQENSYGLVQWSYWTDAKGRIIEDLGNRNEKHGTRHTYTEILIGTHYWNVPLPALAVASIGSIALVVLGWLAMRLHDWTTLRREKPAPPPPAVP